MTKTFKIDIAREIAALRARLLQDDDDSATVDARVNALMINKKSVLIMMRDHARARDAKIDAVIDRVCASDSSITRDDVEARIRKIANIRDDRLRALIDALTVDQLVKRVSAH